MLYELRIYTPRPGRMADLLARFRDRLPALFARHAIRCLGRWIHEEAAADAGAPPTQHLAYLTAFPDMAGREAAWAAFGADPEWHRVRSETNGGSEMLSGYDLWLLRPQHMDTVRHSLLGAPGVHELIFQRVLHGQAAAFSTWLLDWARPAWAETGGKIVGCFELIAGKGLPQRLVWVHWPDAQARLQPHGLRSLPAPAGECLASWCADDPVCLTLRCTR